MTDSVHPRLSFDVVTVGKAFIAGVLGVLVFQYGLAALLHVAGLITNAPYRMNPVPPFGVPQSISSAFWGGLWGIAFLPALARTKSDAAYWITAIVFGAIAVSSVLLFVVFPIKGRAFAAGWSMRTWATVATLHAAFGLGTAFFLRLLTRNR